MCYFEIKATDFIIYDKLAHPRGAKEDMMLVDKPTIHAYGLTADEEIIVFNISIVLYKRLGKQS